MEGQHDIETVMEEQDDIETAARKVMPWPIAKALTDNPWDYVCGLRDGTIIFFRDAGWREGEPFVTLFPCAEMVIRHFSSPIVGPLFKVAQHFTPERGISVRLDEIAWAIDAPFGS